MTTDCILLLEIEEVDLEGVKQNHIDRLFYLYFFVCLTKPCVYDMQEMFVTTGRGSGPINIQDYSQQSVNTRSCTAMVRHSSANQPSSRPSWSVAPASTTPPDLDDVPASTGSENLCDSIVCSGFFFFRMTGMKKSTYYESCSSILVHIKEKDSNYGVSFFLDVKQRFPTIFFFFFKA